MGRKKRNREKGYRKVRGNAGETLVEMMASIVIISLSVTLLFSGVMAAVGIDKRAKRADDEYYQALSAAEARKDMPEEREDQEEQWRGTARITGDSLVEKEMKIRFYGGKGIYAYELIEEGMEEESSDETSEEVLP